MSDDSRRSYGTGSLYVHTDADGQETWYGRWYSGGRRIKRKIGPKRQPGSRIGLTRGQAEAELRQRIEDEAPSPTRPDITVEEAGERMLRHLDALGRKPTTLDTYRSLFRTHLVPHLGSVEVDRATPATSRGCLPRCAARRRAPRRSSTRSRC